MNWNLVFGVLVGLISALLILIMILWWRRGRAARKGRKGEKIVAKELKDLKKRDYIILNNLILPTSTNRTSQIDHIVVSTRGIFVIETKSLAGRISGSEHSQYWTQHMASQSRQIYNPLLQNASHIRVLRRLFPEMDADFFISVIVFTEAWRIDVRADEIVESRTFLPDRHIRRTFIPSERRKRKWWRPSSEVRLDPTRVIVTLEELTAEMKRRKKIIQRNELRQIADKIRENTLGSRQERRTHKEYARDTSRNIAREIRLGICPRCGSRLVIKKGENGEFVGCENYPDCRFTCPIDRLH